MKIFLASFLITVNIFACDFSKEIGEVYSLSGVSTQMIQELGLLKSPKLKGVSIFHPVSKKEFTGKFLAGGQFISFSEMDSWKNALVFFDESRELKNILAKKSNLKSIEVKTRSKLPLEVVRSFKVENENKFSGCDFSAVEEKLSIKLNELKKIIPKDKTVIVFLGKIQKNKFPELVMSNDGIVKYLVSEKVIKSYPSDLAYPNWSTRIMKSLDKDTIKIGLIDSGNDLNPKFEKVSEGVYNLTYPGGMIPGFGQVDALFYFFSRIH